MRAARRAREPRPDRERRPVPRPHARRARRRHAGGGARASDLDDGPEDHDRLGDAREQGPRGDRGALPLRRRRTTASRSSIHPTSIVHGLVRFRDGAAIAHLGYPDMRVPISYALTYPDRAATPVPPLDLTAGPLEFFEPDTDTFRLLALAREAGERGGTYPCAYNAANEVAVAGVPRRAHRLPRDRRARRGRARPRRRRARARPRRAASRRTARARELVEPRMGVVAAILGLALLVLIHEAGHFFAARAVGMTPRKFYLGFGPPLVKTTRGGVEYGIAAIPLGGYVKIPGMNRPSPGDLRDAAAPRTASATARSCARLDAAIERGDDDGARTSYLRAAAGARRDRACGRSSRGRSRRTRTGGRRRGGGWPRSSPGPAVNLVFAIVLFARALHGRRRRASTNVIGRVVAGHARRPPRTAGGRPDPRVAGQTVAAGRHPDAHPRDRGPAVHGSSSTATASASCSGRCARRKIDGAYRIGIAIEARTGPGESPPAAAQRRARADVGRSPPTRCAGSAHLATGRDTDQVSSSVGIVQGVGRRPGAQGCATSCSCSA